MTPLPGEAQLSAVARFMRALTDEGIRRVLRLLAGGGFLWVAYLHHEKWMPLLWGSQLVGAGVALAIVAYATWSHVGTVQRRLEDTMAYQIAAGNLERGELRDRLHAVEIREAQCQARVELLLKEVHLMKQRRRERDAPDTGPDTGPGTLDG